MRIFTTPRQAVQFSIAFIVFAFSGIAAAKSEKETEKSIQARTSIGYQVEDRYGQKPANRRVKANEEASVQNEDQSGAADMVLPLLLGASLMSALPEEGFVDGYDGSVGGSGFAPNVGMNDSGTCSVDLKACAAAAGGANPRGGIGVVVDMAQRCLCLGSDNCFKVGIGSSGPKMTTSGAGRLTGCNKGAKGTIYSDVNPPSTAYDNDCFSTGIPANDGVGKWLHKPRGCGSVASGPQITKGCVAVPCSKWLDLEDFVKKNNNIVVCNGAGGGSVRQPAAAKGGGHAQ